MSNTFKLFKHKAYKSVRVGEWLFEWYLDKKHPERSCMRVMAESGLFDLKIKANSHVFGYLLAAAEQGLADQLHGWITLVYAPAMAMTQDQALVNDIQKSINKWMRRHAAKAESAAKAVTDSDEQASQAFMDDVVSELSINKRELADKHKADGELLKDMLGELNEKMEGR